MVGFLGVEFDHFDQRPIRISHNKVFAVRFVQDCTAIHKLESLDFPFPLYCPWVRAVVNPSPRHL
jgi:hypothetical protein